LGGRSSTGRVPWGTIGQLPRESSEGPSPSRRGACVPWEGEGLSEFEWSGCGAGSWRTAIHRAGPSGND
ncbi:MAG: hypothetical protein LAT55_10170, partial [Opitutales bacterium]|nr:hypothetical protein [Opitutales bacterium]